MRAFRNVNLYLPGAMISLPVSIAKATGESDLKSKVVGSDGGQVRQTYLDANDKEVPREDLKREIEGRVVTQEELSDINDQCKLIDLEILEVCPIKALDFRRVSGSYYVYNNKKSGNARTFKTFVEALKKIKSAAVVKWTPSSRQQLLVLYPEGDALVGSAVCFAEDWRDADEDVLAHTSEKVDAKEIDMAATLLSQVSGDGKSMEEEKDDAIQLKSDLIAGRKPAEVPTEASKPDVGPDLVKQLEASMEALKKEKQAA